MLLKLSLCYYRKHPEKLAVMLAILLSGTVALALTLLFVRSSKMQELENQLTLLGDYDVIAFDCEYTLAEKATALKSVTDSGMYKRTYVTLGGNSVPAMAFRDKHSQEIFHMSMLRGTAPESADEVGLDPDLRRHVRKYSLGMRQRLGLAQAIMENPKILILDEPFNGLDKEGVAEMREYLLSYKEQGKTILICSHSAEDISVLCETVHEMDKGVIQKIS